jgi:hypothetical protein
MDNEAKIYEKGNSWQKKVYRHMSAYLEMKGITSFGQSVNGNKFKHLLTPEKSKHNFITKEIHQAALDRFVHHKAGDLNRTLTNTAASQPYCFNLVIYLQQNPILANKLFSSLLDKPVKVIHIEPEFTPNTCIDITNFKPIGDESIGDQKAKQGTDADIAVFYTFDNNMKGILLIEFKFIEEEFSTCTTFKNNKEIRSSCYYEYYKKLIQPALDNTIKMPRCGYTRYKNWIFTKGSKAFEIKKVKEANCCPFMQGGNQLWRNMLLAERVASSRKCDEFGFWVFSPKENDKYLWKDQARENGFRSILSELGNKNFKKIHLESIFTILHEIVTEVEDKSWLTKMEMKYKIS